MFRLTEGSFIITEDCTLACSYCYQEDARKCAKSMSDEVAYAAIDMFVKNAVDSRDIDKKNAKVNITFFGGEPTMNIPLLRNIVRYTKQKCEWNVIKFGFTLITNGTIWTDEYEEFLLEWKNSGGDFYVQISLDGTPEAHDANRKFLSGRGSAETVVQNIKKHIKFFEKHGIDKNNIKTHSVISKSNLSLIYDSIKYCKEELGVTSWYQLLHEEDWTGEDVVTYSIELKKLGALVFEGCSTNNNLQTYNEYTPELGIKGSKAKYTCMAGKSYCSIDVDGGIHICHKFMFHNKKDIVGNVFTGVDEEAIFPYQEVEFNDIIGVSACADCPNTSCRVCIATNKAYNKNIAIAFPKYCNMSLTQHEENKALEAQLASKGLLQQSNQCGMDNNCSCGNKEEETARLVTSILDSVMTPIIKEMAEKIIELNNQVEEYKLLTQELLNITNITVAHLSNIAEERKESNNVKL